MGDSQIHKGFFCDLGAMSSKERGRHALLSRRLVTAGEGRRELEDGYVFTLSAQKISTAILDEWIALERKCCPFFIFRVEAKPEGETLSVSLTGPPGIKEFIRLEFGE